MNDFPGTGGSTLPAATIGLGVFLAVVTSLFALFISAYFMRMEVADWAQMPAPKVLWFNTGVLILSSVALQYAHVGGRAALCVATAERRRLLLGDQPSQCLLLSAHRAAWAALAWRPGGLGPDD